jgi:NAD(P)H dehydrogenase (quinone)
MNFPKKDVVLVTGASGHIGRRIVDFLLDLESLHVVAGTRTPEKISDLEKRGAELRRIDFDDSASCDVAFQGVDRVVLVSTDAVSEPRRRIRQHRIAVEAAKKAGVKHLIYTSFAQSEAGSPIPLCADHYATEQALEASGLPYTALRNSLYAEAILRRIPTMLEATEVPGLLGAGGIAYITREDCARSAAAVASSEKPPLGPIELTGPEVIDEERLVALVGECIGRPLRFVPMQAAALTEYLVSTGVPLPRALAKVALDTAVATGSLGFTTSAVADLTGVPAMRVRDFLLSTDIGGTQT